VAILTAADLRERVTALREVEKFPDEVLEDLVDEFVEIAQDYRGVAYEPATATDTVILDAPETWVRLAWPKVRSITSVTVTSPTVGGTATLLNATDYSYDAESGHLSYPSGFAAGDKVVAVYQHGLTAAPKALVRAGREYVRACALTDRSSVGRDVLTQSDGQGGSTRYSTPDKNAGRPTGWLEVDRLLNSLEDYRRLVG
jgi:hypothetical protein